MIVTERRLDLKVISSRALGEYMVHRGYSVRALAAAVEREVQRTNPEVTVKHALIGHLRNPRSDRRSVKPVVGRAIEKVLDAPRGSLFIEELSSVQRDTRRPEKVPA